MTEADYFKLYLDELQGITPCTTEETEELLKKIKNGDKEAGNRLIEGKLMQALSVVKDYGIKGLSVNDLVQEANVALMMTVASYDSDESDKDFDTVLKNNIISALDEAVEAQNSEQRIEEEMAARVNVLKDISQEMANELGREATLTELADRMKMTEEEIRDIMKLTMDAMTVNDASF